MVCVIDLTALRYGDSLRRTVDHGSAHSTFEVVVCSKSFLANGWPQDELDGIVASVGQAAPVGAQLRFP